MVEYTNSNGTSGRISEEVPVAPIVRAGGAIRVPLQSGDRGVQSVQKITFSSGWSAGALAIVLVKRITALKSTVINSQTPYGLLYLGEATIDPSACVFFVINSSATVGPQISLQLSVARVA